MDDDLDASEDERAIELSSIEAIFPELKTDPANPYTAELDIPVAPEPPLKIYFRASTDGVPLGLPTPPTSLEKDDGIEVPAHNINTAGAHIDTHELSHLPPLTVRITLGDGYPTTKSPQINLSTTPHWIPTSTLNVLQEDCVRLWEEIGRDQVVFMYIDHLQQSAEHAFGIAKESEHKFELAGDLKLALLDYDLKTKQELFEKETFDCGICLEPKKGVSCHRLLLCGHVFCVSCLQDFYNNCISEGDVDSVKCLSPGCGKEDKTQSPTVRRRRNDRTLNPSELLQIPIEQEMVQRYVRLKRKKKLESDKNTIYCPRQWCQGAARSKKHPKPLDPLNDFEESESEPEVVPSKKKSKTKKKGDPEEVPMSERLCVCEDCNFAFCSVCKKGWHGELAMCNPRRQAELDEEEQASLAYMKKFSTPCPTCNAPAQKSHGCNHMICFKCKTHFCYLCSAFLMPENPFTHFNDFKSTCYMRLWELEGGHGADAGVDGVGGAVNPIQWEPEDFNTESESGSEDDEEDFADFDGDHLDFMADDESDEDDPVAVQPRQNGQMHIEIVNFANVGGNRRIELPQQPQQANAPPPVPHPPRRRGRMHQGGRRPVVRQDIQGAVQRPAQARVVVDAPEPRNLPPAAPGQGNAHPLPAPARAMGLERFLELALNDQEDEWDSDELDDDHPPQPRGEAQARRQRR